MNQKNQDKKELYNAEDDTKTFDMYHTRSHWTVVLGISFVVALLLFVLFLFLFGGGTSIA